LPRGADKQQCASRVHAAVQRPRRRVRLLLLRPPGPAEVVRAHVQAVGTRHVRMRDSAPAAAVSTSDGAAEEEALSFKPGRAGRRLLATALLALSRPSGLEEAMLWLRWREVPYFCIQQPLPFAMQRGGEDLQTSWSPMLWACRGKASLTQAPGLPVHRLPAEQHLLSIPQATVARCALASWSLSNAFSRCNAAVSAACAPCQGHCKPTACGCCTVSSRVSHFVGPGIPRALAMPSAGLQPQPVSPVPPEAPDRAMVLQVCDAEGSAAEQDCNLASAGHASMRAPPAGNCDAEEDAANNGTVSDGPDG